MHFRSGSPRPTGFLLALALGAGVVLAASPSAEVIEQVIVKVNGDILTKSDLEGREAAAIRQRGQQNLTDEELKKAVNEITPQVLVDTVDEMLILQRGRDLGYRLSDDQFKDILERIKKDNKIENDEQFEESKRWRRPHAEVKHCFGWALNTFAAHLPMDT